MFFWGCDVRYSRGNLLVRLGLERLARVEVGGEGSSRYRQRWQEGLIELHSFCVGWYPSDQSDRGIIFIRGRERLLSCESEMPLTPGQYEAGCFRPDTSDSLLSQSRPSLQWIIAYEEQLSELVGPEYRAHCWSRYLAKVGARPWLPPDQALAWYRQLLASPAKIQRPREILRTKKRPSSLGAKNSRPFPTR